MAAEGQDKPRDWDELSVSRRKYKIPSIKTDHSRWDKGREKTLRKLSASVLVFPILRKVWKGDGSEGSRATLANFSDGPGLYRRVGVIQEFMTRFEEYLGESDTFVVAWLLLEEAERKRHLFHGMKEN